MHYVWGPLLPGGGQQQATPAAQTRPIFHRVTDAPAYPYENLQALTWGPHQTPVVVTPRPGPHQVTDAPRYYDPPVQIVRYGGPAGFLQPNAPRLQVIEAPAYPYGPSELVAWGPRKEAVVVTPRRVPHVVVEAPALFLGEGGFVAWHPARVLETRPILPRITEAPRYPHGPSQFVRFGYGREEPAAPPATAGGSVAIADTTGQTVLTSDTLGVGVAIADTSGSGVAVTDTTGGSVSTSDTGGAGVVITDT